MKPMTIIKEINEFAQYATQKKTSDKNNIERSLILNIMARILRYKRKKLSI
jgi:hypothetical protein